MPEGLSHEIVSKFEVHSKFAFDLCWKYLKQEQPSLSFRENISVGSVHP